MNLKDKKPPVQFSCYFSRSSAGEQFIAEHALGYVASGTLKLNDGKTVKTFEQGDLYFCSRNNLNKYVKIPAGKEEFRSVSVFFDQPVLRSFSMEYGYASSKHVKQPAFQPLPKGTVLSAYMESMRAYENLLQQKNTEALMAVKQKEALLILLQIKPELKEILFDFSDPGKIDLEAFMNRNYHFNVELVRFAYLTGRSLSTFKRDFEAVYHTPPSRWLLQRRLREAHYLIKEKGKAVSDVYLDLGFEDLSHFSFAFKKEFGVAPSLV